MNSEDYFKGCTDQLENQHFYRPLDKNPKQVFANEIRREISDLKSNGQITDKEYTLLTEHLNQPRMPIFYGLPYS